MWEEMGDAERKKSNSLYSIASILQIKKIFKSNMNKSEDLICLIAGFS